MSSSPALVGVAGVGALALVAGLGYALIGWDPRASTPPASPAHADATADISGRDDADRDRIAAATLDDCPDAGLPIPLAIPGHTRLRLFRSASVDPVRAREALSAAQRYWARHGLRVTQTGQTAPVAYESMFEGSFAELEVHDGDPKALERALYARLRSFLREHATPDARDGSPDTGSEPGVINVVIVRDIVHPRAAAAAVLGDLVGLTVSAELLAQGDEASALILDALDLGEDFEPTILLSDRHLADLANEAFVAAVAHELGHALGLRHDPRPSNLMARERHTCIPSLAPDQTTRVSATLRRWAHE